jgi:hypothetical protein
MLVWIKIGSFVGVAAVFTLFPRSCRLEASAGPTFGKDVAPILFTHCVRCHQPGQIANLASFLSYEAVRPWAKAIKEKVLMREMPPWPADPNTSVEFLNDSRLKDEEIHTLVAWVDAGAPKGNDADLPKMLTFTKGWLHPNGRAPDAIITLPHFEIPAQGEVPYATCLAKVPFAEDKWVTAIEVRPENPALLHHMAVAEVATDEGFKPADLNTLTQLAKKLGLEHAFVGTRHVVTAPGNAAVYDLLSVYTPGAAFEMYGDGNAKLLKGGKDLYLNCNLHYQTTGKIERDRTRIGLWFQPRPPKRQLFRVPAGVDTLIAGGRELLTGAGKKAEGTSAAIPPIPPYADDYELIGITAMTQAVTIYQFHPHAHLRAKDFKYTVVYGDGHKQTVLSVPKYDFRWQLAYDLKTPLKLPAGSKLVVTAHYDNSVKNRNNPAPDKEVYFREAQNQSWDEMFTPFIQYSIDGEQLALLPSSSGAQQHHDEKPGGPMQEHRRKRSDMNLVEVGGCLEQDAAGTWILNHGSEPVVSKTQATSSAELKIAGARVSGTRRYKLLGVSFFNPSQKGRKVAVKGVLIANVDESRLNITSLQTLAATCAK